MRAVRPFGKFFITSTIIALYALKIFQRVAHAQSKGQALVPHRPGDTQRTVFVPANSSCEPPPTDCDPFYFFYSMDGSCNNLKKTSQGQAGTVYRRMFKAGYADFRRKIRVSVVDGSELPCARQLRTTFLSDMSISSPKCSAYSYGNGQLMTHDVTSFNSAHSIAACCTSGGKKTTPTPDGCIPIEVPANDTFYSRFGIRCLPMNRANSSYDAKCDMDKSSTPFNFVTGRIDQSMIYSNNKNISDTLRLMKGGRMRTFVNNFNQVFFPLTTACPAISSDCWACGDQRVSVGPELAMCTLTFFRYHNVLASTFERVARNLNDQQIFDRCRRLVIACTQHTYYGEYLPSVLGINMCKKFNLLPLKFGRTKYNAAIDGHTCVEYTICGRLGHSQILQGLQFQGFNGGKESYDLQEIFLNQTFLMQDTTFPRLLQAYHKNGCNQQDEHGVPAISNFLFPNRFFGGDLPAMDMQRGRDMGMPDYNSVRKGVGLSPVRRFEELIGIIKRPEYVAKLKTFYKSVDDLDLYLIAALELQDTDAVFGPTCNNVMAKSCNEFKFGDRYWYEHDGPTAISTESLTIIRQIKLCHIICWTNPTTPGLMIPENAYEVPSKTNPARSCADIIRTGPDLSLLCKFMAREGFPKNSKSPFGRP